MLKFGFFRDNEADDEVFCEWLTVKMMLSFISRQNYYRKLYNHKPLTHNKHVLNRNLILTLLHEVFLQV